MEAIINKIKVLLAEKFTEEAFSACFLVDIRTFQKPRIEVFVDCDHGVSHEMCVLISRHIEKYLDESMVLGEKYTLEVSSPGLDRPLMRRQFPKNIGRELKVKKASGDTIKGSLKEVTEDGIILAVTDKKLGEQLFPVRFDEMEYAKVIVSF